MHNLYSRFTRLKHMDIHMLSIGFLAVSVFLYACLGSPTPDDPGWLEFFIGLFLVVGAVIGGGLHMLAPRMSAPLWRSAAQFAFYCGITFPVIGAIVGGHDMRLFMRDFIPFIFMMAPLFYAANAGRSDFAFKSFVSLIIVLGGVFALRAMWDALPFVVPFLEKPDALSYLANMPTVLCAAILLAGYGVMYFVRVFTVSAALRLFVLCALAAVCLWPIAVTQQRASIGVFIISLLALLSLLARDYPRRCAFVFGVLVCASIPFWPILADIYAALLRKTSLVGGNMRVQELAAVWDTIRVHPLSVFLGMGWGAVFSSPAVADIKVNFTHSLISSMLLKTGIMGTLAVTAYLTSILRMGWAALSSYPVIIIAAAGPVLIDIFLYASFKSLDFGLCLCLLAAAYFYGEEGCADIAYQRPVMYSKKNNQNAPQIS